MQSQQQFHGGLMSITETFAQPSPKLVRDQMKISLKEKKIFFNSEGGPIESKESPLHGKRAQPGIFREIFQIIQGERGCQNDADVPRRVSGCHSDGRRRGRGRLCRHGGGSGGGLSRNKYEGEIVGCKRETQDDAEAADLGLSQCPTC